MASGSSGHRTDTVQISRPNLQLDVHDCPDDYELEKIFRQLKTSQEGRFRIRNQPSSDVKVLMDPIRYEPISVTRLSRHPFSLRSWKAQESFLTISTMGVVNLFKFAILCFGLIGYLTGSPRTSRETQSEIYDREKRSIYLNAKAPILIGRLF